MYDTNDVEMHTGLTEKKYIYLSQKQYLFVLNHDGIAVYTNNYTLI